MGTIMVRTKCLILLLVLGLQGCPPLEEENPNHCEKIVDCNVYEESYCEQRQDGQPGKDCYHNFSEYCMEKFICPNDKKSVDL